MKLDRTSDWGYPAQVSAEDEELLERGRRIVLASWIGIVGNAVLAVLKTVVGLIAGSAAVISDGIDSGLDVLTSAITLVAARITTKPPDIDHPYGHSRAEAIATKSLSFIIFFAGAQLASGTIRRLLEQSPPEVETDLAILVTLASILGKSLLASHKWVVGRRQKSAMLIADAKNMRGDIVISFGVLFGLAAVRLFDLPIIDSIAALLISAWIMYLAFRIFIDTNTELMEGHKDRSTYEEIFDAVEGVAGAEHPHRTRIRTVGSMHIVDLDIEVDGELTVREAHAIAQKTEQAIKGALGNVYDVLVHIEPLGNVEKRERYGVSKRKLDAESSRRER
ncbi:MAG: cation diffusion facilitator family transporter [Spirochaetaceae bacterium]